MIPKPESSPPVRSCRVCRTRRPQDQLLRWVVGPTGLIRDQHPKLPGRGYYSCPGRCAELMTQTLGKQKRKQG